MHFLLVNESPLNTRAKRDAVTGSHHSRGAAYSSAHKRTMRARSTQEIAAMQFTIVRQRWRTQSHTHSHTFIRTITQLLTHTLTYVHRRTHWCWLFPAWVFEQFNEDSFQQSE
ncbi:hypothetical protein GOODEAATRI_016361 [Goodea atripinnis]|uniref:Uncharacterized protein n=1 Tax=Goodea atripinnis TaxID=208336 RepID=A0ABV0NKR8_9TELE